MRERLRLSDLHILFVCLDSHHGPLSRRTLVDASTFRNTGGNAMIVCPPGSPLDKAAELQDIPRYPLEAPADWRALWRLYQLTKHLVKKDRLDLVHCYSYRPLVALGAALKSAVKVPLVYTSNENLAEAYLSFWHDYSVTRVDQVLTFSSALGDTAAEVLPLNPHKVLTLGAGVDFPKPRGKERPQRDGWRLCTYLPVDEKTLDRIMPLLQALPAVAHELHRPVVLELLTEGSWYEHPLYAALKHVVLERGLEHKIAFGAVSWSGGGALGQHLFIGLDSIDPFDDVELQAMLQQIPVLLPRTAARSQMLQGNALGLTYYPLDVREMKVKILEVLAKNDRFKQELTQWHSSILEQHGHEHYTEELFQLYERLVLQRLRFALKSRSVFGVKGS